MLLVGALVVAVPGLRDVALVLWIPTLLGTGAFLAFLMSLCNQRFTATQFALLSAFSSVGLSASPPEPRMSLS